MCAFQAVHAAEPTRTEIDSMPGRVVLEFGTGWCPHCQAVQPALKQWLDDHPDVEHVKVEDGKGRPLGRSFRVKLWPTLILLKDGTPTAELVRPSSAELREAFERFVQ